MRNKKEYPENWVDTVRPAILKRDEYKCRLCKVKHRQFVLVDDDGRYTKIDEKEYLEYKEHCNKVYRIYLQVAHLNHDKKDCSDSNLMALCPKCHLKYDKESKLLTSVGYRAITY